jgi:hypothetical protein
MAATHAASALRVGQASIVRPGVGRQAVHHRRRQRHELQEDGRDQCDQRAIERPHVARAGHARAACHEDDRGRSEQRKKG